MSDLLRSIREQLPGLNPKEQALAAFIADHPQLVVRLSITELADQSQTSAATVSRFCKNFHAGGYSGLKMQLATELALQPAGDSYQDIVAGNTLESIVSAMEANHIRSISDTSRLLDPKLLEQAVAALHAAGQIDIYGVATSGVVAQDFYQKLVRIGKKATAFSDPHMQVTSASNLSDGDTAFAISYSGETPETIDALRCARERGATTVSLTKFGPNTLSALADIPLYTSSLEEGMRRGDMASRIAQLHVIDILFTGLISESFDDYVPKLELSYQMVKKYRKEKGR
ncbi:MurR/RpiR family transcriptional regulator [Paenibacillus ginsengarvi]|uniref:MurR/RpiR family transcriptional regulator n=1 Tax=Paenibacillus ginsengarvi TaxID=400777 RepID=A0A3B0CIP0_9BACL|nr:MurR/RpiR family transcriptional regulator [Paenibacillus ginsengarvi]RKN85535.1 MurR/RpiR family transcriptional regulator [Paenibacillus ginsengarvi]